MIARGIFDIETHTALHAGGVGGANPQWAKYQRHEGHAQRVQQATAA